MDTDWVFKPARKNTPHQLASRPNLKMHTVFCRILNQTNREPKRAAFVAGNFSANGRRRSEAIAGCPKLATPQPRITDKPRAAGCTGNRMGQPWQRAGLCRRRPINTDASSRWPERFRRESAATGYRTSRTEPEPSKISAPWSSIRYPQREIAGISESGGSPENTFGQAVHYADNLASSWTRFGSACMRRSGCSRFGTGSTNTRPRKVADAPLGKRR